MRVAIDGMGRIVIPEPLREELGLTGPGELELTALDGLLELTVPDVRAHIEEREGFAVIVRDRPGPELTSEMTLAAIERSRRDRARRLLPDWGAPVPSGRGAGPGGGGEREADPGQLF
jgi:bifunctional DNA-binding transcriptional regulator/antitoxin component of YhaV-PrlF toxin-antitoxin module